VRSQCWCGVVWRGTAFLRAPSRHQPNLATHTHTSRMHTHTRAQSTMHTQRTRSIKSLVMSRSSSSTSASNVCCGSTCLTNSNSLARGRTCDAFCCSSSFNRPSCRLYVCMCSLVSDPTSEAGCWFNPSGGGCTADGATACTEVGCAAPAPAAAPPCRLVDGNVWR
jgi:hypothetical protein